MANTNQTPTFGPNKTKVSTITHAAVASWGGFVYQGLCALCVAVEKILEDEDNVRGWYLNVEGYEDCAVLNDKKKIVSLHQAKCYKYDKGFEDEFMKMEDKRAYWHDKGFCKPDIPLYFHCNLQLKYSHGVVEYEYNDGNVNKSHEDVWKHLESLVEKYTRKNNIPVSSDIKFEQLIANMSNHITMLDEMAKDPSNSDMLAISVEKSISFASIINLLRSDKDRMTVAERVRASAFYLRVCMEQFKFNNTDIDYAMVDRFTEALECMSSEEQERVIRKLFPDVDIAFGSNIFAEITNSYRFAFLRNIILEANQMNDNDIQWRIIDGLAHPSTLGRGKSIKELCMGIMRNKNLPSELLRDYRWIVGDRIGEIDDIKQGAGNITSTDDANYDNITKPRKVGLTDADGINNRMV